MRLRIDINKDGTKNFYVMESYRTEAKKSTTRIVKKLGTYDQLINEHEDPEAWARGVVAEMNRQAQEGKQKVMVPYLATLSIPSLGVNVKVYEGTDSATLAKGGGHFTDTSIWDGNVSVAGHNRGTNCYFGNIHTLKQGDEITLTTKLGTRTYYVTEVKKISETDNSDTASTSENCITLFTCVRNESAYRWRVRAVEALG